MKQAIVRALAPALLALLLIPGAPPWGADEGSDRKRGEEKAQEPTPEKPSVPEEQERLFRTNHRVVIDGKELKYRATAGEIHVALEQTKIEGSMFYVAYELENARGTSRPITFAFNGGPGAAAVWLHLGALGPQRVILSEDGKVLPPPVRYSENPYTWLPFTDLVFIDPVGTGFSHGIPDKPGVSQKFYGVQQDIESVAEFIRLYLTRNNRWLSPVFLVGESYGTTRAAGLSEHLQERYGIRLNGIVLISPVLDFDTVSSQPTNDLPYMLFLPTYTATAWHYRLLPPLLGEKELEEVLGLVEKFCVEEYMDLLVQGNALTEDARRKLIQTLHAFTALSPEVIEWNHFRISWADFSKNLLRKRNQLVGRMDTTVTGIDTDPAAPYPAYDPSLDSLYGPFSSAMNAYVRDELGFKSDRMYEFLNDDVNARWDWKSGLSREQGFIDFSRNLRKAVAVNPSLKIFIASGVFDLATPYFAAVHTVNHLWLGEQQGTITHKRYRAGHMLFLHAESLAAFTGDVRAFYDEALRK